MNNRNINKIFFLLFFICAKNNNVKSVSVTEYFPEIGDDLGAVTWAHGVNNQTFLNETLENDVMMLEADVSLGFLLNNETNDNKLMPIMAHPPAKFSDLSLNQFLEQVIIATESGMRKGIKLDFKSIEVLEPALNELSNISHRISSPVWLNADIVSGPVGSTSTPVNATEFLRQCKTRFPTSTLSTGWKTKFGPQNDGSIISEGSYTPQQIQEMIDLLRYENIEQDVTFPVRAGIAAHSTTELITLLSGYKNSTLTLWGSVTDPVDVPALKNMVETIGRDKIYIDVPQELEDALNSAKSTIIAPALLFLSTLASITS